MNKLDIKVGEYQKMPISSQASTKDGKWWIINKYRHLTENGNIKYTVDLKCKTCGFIKKNVGLHHTYSKPTLCIQCFRNRHVGKIYGCYKIIKFERYDPIRRKEYYEMECIHCGRHYHNKLANYNAMKDTKHCRFCTAISEDPTINAVYTSYIWGAKQRGLNFDLSPAQFLNLIHQNCFYCDAPPIERNTVTTHKHQYSKNLNGIDRLNSSKGYTIDNCVPCCKQCNKMKMEYSVEDFYSKIRKIFYHKHLGEGSETIENAVNTESE